LSSSSYDVGHLYNLAFLLEKGLIEPPLFVQTVFGILGGIGTHPEDLLHMKRTADRLFGDEYVWSVLAAGRHQTPLVTQGAILGGNVRVGLEDSIYLARGVLAESNAQQVEKITRILGELSLEIATPDEARQKLGLKGRDRTAIPT
jgi:3,5-dioxohexanoate:acetyl-CoA acetone transferase